MHQRESTCVKTYHTKGVNDAKTVLTLWCGLGLKPQLTLLLRHAVHHRPSEHQDVCAAVGASSQTAVAAQTCRAKNTPKTRTRKYHH